MSAEIDDYSVSFESLGKAEVIRHAPGWVEPVHMYLRRILTQMHVLCRSKLRVHTNVWALAPASGSDKISRSASS